MKHLSLLLNLDFVFQELGVFNRGKGLQIGAQSRKDSDIIVFMDVDLVFDEKYIHRIQRNVIQGKRAYFPVFFSQFDPELVYDSNHLKPKTPWSLNERDGFWRIYSYGMVAIYKSDFDKTGGFNLDISGWGEEDLQFADACMNSGLDIYRSVDSELIHIFHPKFCDLKLTEVQYNDCYGSMSNHFGAKTTNYVKFLRDKRYRGINENIIKNKLEMIDGNSARRKLRLNVHEHLAVLQERFYNYVIHRKLVKPKQEIVSTEICKNILSFVGLKIVDHLLT